MTFNPVPCNMKKFLIGILLICGFLLPGISAADNTDDDNAEVAVIVKNIKKNGSPELRQLSTRVIYSTALSFVAGRRTGVVTTAQLARLGGVRGATESALDGQLKAMGHHDNQVSKREKFV
jgi:hypothetical protein